MKYQPYTYQQHATRHILQHKGAGLMLEMGLGKTVATLTAIDELLHTGQVAKVLVIAPLRVAESVWPDEVQKWDHLHHISYALVLGAEKNRRAALLQRADIHIVNRENVQWLVSYYQSKWPFDMVIVDESSSFKNPKSRRFRALKTVMPKVKRTVILTGTPTPHSYLDLWSQVYLLDQGTRLGDKFTAYREQHFVPGARNGHVIYDYQLKKPKKDEIAILGADLQERIIFDKVRDICISMKARDYLDLPDLINRDINVHLPDDILEQYHQFEESRVLELAESGEAITAMNAAAVAIKLLQFANGAIYSDDGNSYTVIHDAKLEALAELVEVATSPVLIFYAYRHDLTRMAVRLKEFKPVVLEGRSEIDQWNAGKIRILLAHPASAGHGLNLQAGGHNVLWFGVPAPRSLELYQQGIARLDRLGQIKSVINQRLMARGTLDPEAFHGLEVKADMQNLFMNHIKAKVNKLMI